MKFQIPDVKTTLEGIASLMENDIEKKVEVSSLILDTQLALILFFISKFPLKSR
jgi:hypothetical protein